MLAWSLLYENSWGKPGSRLSKTTAESWLNSAQYFEFGLKLTKNASVELLGGSALNGNKRERNWTDTARKGDRRFTLRFVTFWQIALKFW